MQYSCYEPNIACYNYMKERFINNPKIKLFMLFQILWL